ncbi:MAG: CDP-glucose 4,6-dehydratase [Candidatus Omnitrophota bacterium]
MTGDLKDFYSGKKVLVTGHTGFKGSWLSLWLLELGCKVGGYALSSDTEPNLYGILGLSDKVTEVIADIRDREKAKSFVKEFSPDIVIHMAAQPLVRRSYKDPALTYETNVMGTVNLLEACREAPSVRSIVNVTSDKCYDNHGEDRPYSETDPMGGHDPYSSSKGCSELVSSAYSRSYFSEQQYGATHKTALATARSGNVIGGGDWSEDRLIPDAIRAFLKHEPLVVRYPDAVRPWQYVLEPLYGYLLLARNLYEKGRDFSGPWNFGPDEKEAKPVSWIAEHTANIWGNGAKWQISDGEKPHEARNLKLNSEKACTLLGWHSTIDLEESVEKTMRWYDVWQKGGDIYRYSLREIDLYRQRINI